jgi:hypothetical protein
MAEEKTMKFQGVNPDTVQCKDCAFRDKMVFDHKGKKINIGATKAFCEIYDKNATNGKPAGILFDAEKCKYYMKED